MKIKKPSVSLKEFRASKKKKCSRMFGGNDKATRLQFRYHLGNFGFLHTTGWKRKIRFADEPLMGETWSKVKRA